PGVRVARILVDVQVLLLLVRADGARVAIEPHAVPQNRSAHRDVAVVALDERRLLAEIQRAEVVVDVARLSPLAGVAHEAGPAERVAAGLRDDVEGRSAAVGLAEAA